MEEYYHSGELERVKRIYKQDYEMIDSLDLTPERPVFRRACRVDEKGEVLQGRGSLEDDVMQRGLRSKLNVIRLIWFGGIGTH